MGWPSRREDMSSVRRDSTALEPIAGTMMMMVVVRMMMVVGVCIVDGGAQGHQGPAGLQWTAPARSCMELLAERRSGSNMVALYSGRPGTRHGNVDFPAPSLRRATLTSSTLV